MYKIVICCASGMSTSLLVEKMKRSAREQGIDADIIAVGASQVHQEGENADCILLGPQVLYAKDKLTKDLNAPCAMISMRDYGMMDGENVLKTALSLIENRAVH